MTIVDNEFVNLIKYLIYGEQAPIISDWNVISRKLMDHAIVPLLWNENRINELDVLENVRAKFENIWVRQLRNFMLIQNVTDEMGRILEPYDGKPVILKGLSAAKYYDTPMLRTVGDIDFLVWGGISFDEIKNILIRNGYEDIEEEKDPDVSYMRHDKLVRNGISLEMHRYFSDKENEYDNEIDNIISNSDIVESSMGNDRFYSLQDSANGLVLIQHINHHLTEGLGLRQIIDWLYYVETTLTDELWENEFQDIVKRTGLETLTISVTRMCEMFLGLSHRKFAETADDEACGLLMEDIIDAGNFGKNRDQVVNHMVGFVNSGNFFSRLQRGGLKRWNAAKKHKYLRPFAWIYQAFRITGIMIGRFLSGKSVKGASEMANQQDELFRRLKIGKYRQ